MRQLDCYARWNALWTRWVGFGLAVESDGIVVSLGMARLAQADVGV